MSRLTQYNLCDKFGQCLYNITRERLKPIAGFFKEGDKFVMRHGLARGHNLDLAVIQPQP
jgi:hypothetical protein